MALVFSIELLITSLLTLRLDCALCRCLTGGELVGVCLTIDSTPGLVTLEVEFYRKQAEIDYVVILVF
uniref:Putative secreted protein n=1 Tax=Anopheles triannulatus TaxID=58253 RepID=A0A2M4B658_9DIPT